MTALRLLQVWIYWVAGIAIMTGIGVVLWYITQPKRRPADDRRGGQEFLSAHPVSREGDRY